MLLLSLCKNAVSNKGLKKLQLDHKQVFVLAVNTAQGAMRMRKQVY